MKRFGQEESTSKRQRPGQSGPKQPGMPHSPASIQKAEEPAQRKSFREPRAAQETKRAAALKAKETKPSSVIDSWTGEDMVQGIILSEILGPPKSKRKK